VPQRPQSGFVHHCIINSPAPSFPPLFRQWQPYNESCSSRRVFFHRYRTVVGFNDTFADVKSKSRSVVLTVTGPVNSVEAPEYIFTFMIRNADAAVADAKSRLPIFLCKRYYHVAVWGVNLIALSIRLLTRRKINALSAFTNALSQCPIVSWMFLPSAIGKENSCISDKMADKSIRTVKVPIRFSFRPRLNTTLILASSSAKSSMT